MGNDSDSSDSSLHEEIDPDGQRKSDAESAGEALTRIELDLAYSSEKVLNLDILLMHVASRLSDYEALAMENEAVSTDSEEKAIEFDILSGILYSEVKELECFMSCLQKEIVNAHQKISSFDHLEMRIEQIKEKLHDAEECLKQSQDQVSEIKMRSANFEKTLDFGWQQTCNDRVEFSDYFTSLDTKWTVQTIEHQRRTLQMLEKSLATELDLEKKLSDARHSEEEIKLKLHYAEHEYYCMEEAMEVILGRLYEAENANVVFMEISKELTGKLQIIQFNLNSSVRRENSMRSKLEQSMPNLSAGETSLNLDKLVQQKTEMKSNLKEAEDKSIMTNSEALRLKGLIKSLEQKLRESDTQLQQQRAYTKASEDQQHVLIAELTDRENVIVGLTENIAEAQSRVYGAEGKCATLIETNLKLNEELDFLKEHGLEKADLLEAKLKESNTQLEHAKASVGAFEEQQIMLYSSLNDMESVIEDLKTKVLKAEKRAENAESKCALLTETNLEQSEEIGFLKGKLESLQTSLHQAEDVKIATSKEIGIRTKIITDLITKLALERERLHMQLSTLRKENEILKEKSWKVNDNGNPAKCYNGEENGKDSFFQISSEAAATESSTTNFKVQNSVCKSSTAPTVSVDENTAAESELLPVRTIEAGQLSLKHVAMAALVLLLAAISFYLTQLESCPF